MPFNVRVMRGLPHNDIKREISHTALYTVILAIVRCLGVTYLCLGILKLHGLLFPQEVMQAYLSVSNPIIPFLANQTVLMVAAAAEILVGLYVLFSRNSLSASCGLLLWLCAITMCYKLILVIVHYQGPCGCLLGIDRFLPIPIATQKLVSDIILLASLVISLGGCLYSSRLLRGRAVATQAKSRNSQIQVG